MAVSFRFVGIDHVQLAAPRGCEEEARAFYAGLLGMDEIPKPESLRGRGGVWFQCGRHQVHIGVQDDFVAARKAHPAFGMERIVDLRAHLQAHAVEIAEDAAIEGVERFHIRDPFGNRLEFVERRG